MGGRRASLRPRAEAGVGEDDGADGVDGADGLEEGGPGVEEGRHAEGRAGARRRGVGVMIGSAGAPLHTSPPTHRPTPTHGRSDTPSALTRLGMPHERGRWDGTEGTFLYGLGGQHNQTKVLKKNNSACVALAGTYRCNNSCWHQASSMKRSMEVTRKLQTSQSLFRVR